MQRGDGFAERLRNAHHDVAARRGRPVVQIGMDTPQVEPRHLHEAESLLERPDDAVLGPADDGGWWLLGVGGPHLLEHLADVPMSTADTGRLTRAALEKAGARVVRRRVAARRRRGRRRRGGGRARAGHPVRPGLAATAA